MPDKGLKGRKILKGNSQQQTQSAVGERLFWGEETHTPTTQRERPSTKPRCEHRKLEPSFSLRGALKTPPYFKVMMLACPDLALNLLMQSSSRREGQ